MTNTLTTAFVLVMAINVFLFLGQVAVLELNTGASSFYNCEGTTLGEFEQQGCTNQSSYLLDDTNPQEDLPSGESSVAPDTGVVFTDSFIGSKSWFVEGTGLSYLLTILTAPSNFLKAMGLPSAASFAIGTMWYALTLFLLVAFLFGRET